MTVSLQYYTISGKKSNSSKNCIIQSVAPSSTKSSVQSTVACSDGCGSYPTLIIVTKNSNDLPFIEKYSHRI